jgi:glycosyltransferase involved in cell wall biosynthesis
MRVAHVITRMIVGGAQENTLYNCLDLIREHGDEVLLITGPTDGPEGRLLVEGRAGGLPVKTIDSLQRSIHPTHDIAAYRDLKKSLEQFKPDVVHTHSAKAGVIGRAVGWRLSKKSVKPLAVIHTVHGAPFHPYQSFVARFIYRQCEAWAAKRCHHLISVADAMTALMVDAKVAPREKFTTIYSGMEVEPFLNSAKHREATRRELGISEGEIVVGKVARLFELKGHEYLIDAAPTIVAKHPSLKFLLVGDGSLRAELERRIDALGLKKNFIFTGLVPPESIPKYLSAMDLLVHTSLREGLARTLPQALISGKPVVSYDIDGAREVCITDETGILLPPKSIDLLANAISRLAASSELRETWGRAGRAKFTEQFRHTVMTAHVREVYKRFLIEPSSSA